MPRAVGKVQAPKKDSGESKRCRPATKEGRPLSSLGRNTLARVGPDTDPQRVTTRTTPSTASPPATESAAGKRSRNEVWPWDQQFFMPTMTAPGPRFRRAASAASQRTSRPGALRPPLDERATLHRPRQRPPSATSPQNQTASRHQPPTHRRRPAHRPPSFTPCTPPRPPAGPSAGPCNRNNDEPEQCDRVRGGARPTTTPDLRTLAHHAVGLLSYTAHVTPRRRPPPPPPPPRRAPPHAPNPRRTGAQERAFAQNAAGR